MRILITGGSSGLGKSIVKKLSENKENDIFFTYNRSEESANKMCKENKNIKSIKCDFTIKKELDEFIENLKNLEIDILINNYYSWPENPLLPGTFLNKNFHKIDEELFVDEFKRNVIPTVLITQEIIKLFRSKKNGKILTTLTSFLNSPTIGSSIYLSNKNYLKSLCNVWAVENKKFNINSYYFSPSFMITGHTSKMDERLVDQMVSSSNSNKLMTVDHVSEKISDFLNSDELNGSNEIIL